MRKENTYFLKNENPEKKLSKGSDWIKKYDDREWERQNKIIISQEIKLDLNCANAKETFILPAAIII